MSQTQPVVGVDIAKVKFDVALLQADGQVQHQVFDNHTQGFQACQRWLKQHGGQRAPICLEATGYYYLALADFFHHTQHPVHVINPSRVKAYADSQLRRNKTDKLDATLIADFCRSQQPPLWTPPSGDERELLALVRRYHDLQETLQAEKNRLQAGIPSDLVQTDIAAHIAFLQERLASLKRDLCDLVKRHPALKQSFDLLTSIPGIGDLTACCLLAELPHWQQFDNGRQVVAFAGLNPKHHDSGQQTGRYTPISKQGSASLRAALYMPALAALRCNPLLIAFAERLRARGLTGKVLVVALMRKLLLLAFGVLKSGQPFDPHYLENRVALP